MPHVSVFRMSKSCGPTGTRAWGAGSDPHLHEGDLRFEPRGALSPGGDGLTALRMIVAGARDHLVAGGHLVVEHGYDQSAAVQALFRDAGFDRITVRNDLAGIARIVGGTLPAA
jgi:release factor glutamine methyltransferase